MLRLSAALEAGLVVWTGLIAAAPRSAAQEWNDPPTMTLVERATALRAAQLADTSLVDYRATAHGYVTFLAQVGAGFPEPPKVVRVDELALQVYWHAPGLSKQIIVGRRDTLLAPTDIAYHRDHLGIVQNNFPSIIRIGEGDEVRDVPHPLSADGLRDYDFAIRDSLAIRMPDRTLDVYEVAVRPKDETQPRVVGAIYLDRGTAQVVRMAFDFTHASYLQPELEDISVVLENALVNGRYWLPRRQEIEIRRAGSFLDFPLRGIIRGRWEICCYDINAGVSAAMFGAPEIVQAPPRVTAAYPWHGNVLDSLPSDVRAVTAADVRRVEEEARELVRAQALAPGVGAAPSAHRLSDFARVNRVEGLAVGAGALVRIEPDIDARLVGRWGIDDHEPKGRATFEVRRGDGRGLALFAERDYRDMGDVPEGSLLVNSLAAQEFGTDRTEPYDVRAAGIGIDAGQWLGVQWHIAASHESQDRLTVHAESWSGTYRPTVPAWSIFEERLGIDANRTWLIGPFGSQLRLHAQARGGWFTGRDTSFAQSARYYGRLFADVELDRAVGADRFVWRATAAVVGGKPDVPPQDLVYLGGPVTGPGYDVHAFAAKLGVSQRIEWRLPVPFVPISLGEYGRSPGAATLAPYVHTVYVTDAVPGDTVQGWYPSVGAGLIVLFDLVRFDVARGLRDGRWSFSVDMTSGWWGIL